MRILSCSIAVLLPCMLHGQTRPLVDHHQHLFRPVTVELVSQKPLPLIALPADVDALLQAQARSALDAAALREIYTDDVWLTQSSVSSWIRGRDAVASWWTRWRQAPFKFSPVGVSLSDSAGFVMANVLENGDPLRHVANLLLSVRKNADGLWRIAAEAVSSAGPAIEPVSARDLVALLDQAGIRHALVLSAAYTWANPARNFSSMICLSRHSRIMNASGITAIVSLWRSCSIYRSV